MWPTDTLTALLRIDVPIVQAPMIVQEPLVPLAAAVCNAGGLGSLGCAEMSVADIARHVSEMREATERPFNLNFFLHEPPSHDQDLDRDVKKRVAPLYDALGLEMPATTDTNPLIGFNDKVMSLLLDLRPAMVSFHFGCPSPEISRALRAAGIVTAATATNVREAIMLERAGVGIVVAQGWEAGGHRGSFICEFEDTGIGTMALVPQIADAVACPVVAAGGIGDGRGIAAAFSLGASGVWMGTSFLSCAETPISDQHRAALTEARDEDTHLSRAFSGRPCRARRNRYSEALAVSRPALQAFPLMYNYSGPLKRHGIDNHDLDFQFLLYGQAASLNRNQTAAELIARLTAEAESVFTQFSTELPKP